MMEIWENFKHHTKSSRFMIIMTVIFVDFIAAIITTIFTGFPFALFASILNGLGLGLYITKTLEPGARQRRNGFKQPEIGG